MLSARKTVEAAMLLIPEERMLETSARVMFVYLGRRGLSRFALDVVRAALAVKGIAATIVVSRQNESYAAFSELGDAHLPVDTFYSNAGAITRSWRIPVIRRKLVAAIRAHQPDVVIELMPHVWSSFIAPAVSAMGVRYVSIIHDANTHPGDYRSASVAMVVRRTLRQADTIVTLSRAVADRLKASGVVPAHKIFPLFHPDLNFCTRNSTKRLQPARPVRLVFLGRILPYKGLPIFLDMVDELRRRGTDVEFGIFGEGDLAAISERLSAMGAEVINRWLTEAEIGALLPRFHAMVLSHVEASQSGVAATALGAGLPVIATPVGGITEQISDGVTGVVAKRPDALALADAVQALVSDPEFYQQVCRQIASLKEDRSMSRFVAECVRLAQRRIEVPVPSAGSA